MTSDQNNFFLQNHILAVFITWLIRFDLTLLPDYNIEEKQSMKLFIKIPPFEVWKKILTVIMLDPRDDCPGPLLQARREVGFSTSGSGVLQGETSTASRLCQKEILVYSNLFRDMKAFLDHPIKVADTVWPLSTLPGSLRGPPATACPRGAWWPTARAGQCGGGGLP